MEKSIGNKQPVMLWGECQSYWVASKRGPVLFQVLVWCLIKTENIYSVMWITPSDSVISFLILNMSQWQGMFPQVKHAWTCLLGILTTWHFHAKVAKGKEPGAITTPWHWIPATWVLDNNHGLILEPISWIPDSKAVGSGFHRPKLPGFWITLHGENYSQLGATHFVGYLSSHIQCTLVE